VVPVKNVVCVRDRLFHIAGSHVYHSERVPTHRDLRHGKNIVSVLQHMQVHKSISRKLLLPFFGHI